MVIWFRVQLEQELEYALDKDRRAQRSFMSLAYWVALRLMTPLVRAFATTVQVTIQAERAGKAPGPPLHADEHVGHQEVFEGH